MATSRWSLRNIYLYLVCLITLIMVIVGTVGTIRSVVELVYPEPTYIEPIPKEEDGKPAMTEAEWQRQQEIGREQSRRWAIINLVGNVALVVVAGPLYVYHWRKIETEKDDPSKVTAQARS